MNISLNITGGMGITINGSLGIEELPKDTAAIARSVLNAKALAATEKRRGNPLQTEVQIYRLGLSDETTGTRVFKFDETQCTPELLDILDELTATLKRKLIAARGKQPR